MRAWIAITAVPTLLVTLGSAQEVTGRIEGRVLGIDSAPLPEVEVTASSPTLLGTRHATTDRTGRFRLPALPVGIYQVAARRIGFHPVVVTGVPVRLGETASLPRITLPEAPVELTELTVTAAEVGLDPASTASSTRLEARQLDQLPLPRNFRDIMLLAPAAIPSYLGQSGGVPDGINVGGATGLENSYFVDGIDITNPINGKNSLDLPYNFVQQIEIRTGGSTAEDAQALGGVVNIVTPSGGDRFSGRLFGFYSSDGMQTDARSVLGSYQTGFRSYDIGATLGGPLLRERLWFFAAYNRTSDRQEQTLPFGPLSANRAQNLFAGKLTWSPGPRTAAVLTVLGDPTHLEPLTYPLFGTGIPQNPEVLMQTGQNGGLGLSLRANQFVTPDLLIEGSVAQMTRLYESEPATPAGRTPVVIDNVTGTLYGGNGTAFRFDSRRRSVSLKTSWRLGSHALRAGVLYESLFLDQSIDIARTGAGGEIIRVNDTTWNWHSNLTRGGRGENRMPSVFIQDAWQVSDRLLLNAGLRWSQQTMHNLNAGNVSFQVNDGLLPRFGAVYQLGRIGTQRLYLSYARVANQIAPWGAELNGFGAETLFVFPQNPRIDTTGGSIAFAKTNGAGAYGAGTLRGETADDWAIGYDRQLTRHLGLSVRAVRRAHRDAVQLGGDGNTPFTPVYGNLGRGELAHFPRMSRTYQALELTLERSPGPRSPWIRVSYVLSRTYGNYPGLYGSDWQLDFAHAGPLYNVPAQLVNGTGLLPNDRTHVLKLFGSQRLGSRLLLGTTLMLASGTPLSEYGAIPPGFPFRNFVSQRGTAGRTPMIWDWGIRAAYDVPTPSGAGMQARLLLDFEHVGSPRKAVNYDQIHFACDSAGNQSCPNAGYGRVTQYQPPMTARIGLEVGF